MLKKNLDDLDANGEIGDWCFYHDGKGVFTDMFLVYPVPSSYRHLNGEEPYIKDLVHLYIHLPGTPEGKKPSWEWNGDKDAPTLSPSINVIDRWHGYLRDGKMETV